MTIVLQRRLIAALVVWACSLAGLAQTTGAFSVDTLSDELFRRMQGRSFPSGCTVGRHQLRHLRMLHYDADGRVQQGEMVCNEAIAADLIDIFRQLYQARYPIERMRLIDDYDADDERSMAHNNTSCFCYRPVAGSQRLSRHALGMAVDINPLYNPCVKTRRGGNAVVQPAKGKPYADRSRKSPYRLVKGDLCYRLFTEHGFVWGGAWRSLKDYQHFER